jgi:hypothetical protein
MHVKDLRAALQEIEEIFAAAGARALQEDLSSVIELLAEKDELELPAFLEVLKNTLSGRLPDTPNEWLRRLSEVELNEAVFLKVFSELAEAPCTKAQLVSIAESYTGTKVKSKQSKRDLLEAIKSEFYGRLYDRDADKIAERATPW